MKETTWKREWFSRIRVGSKKSKYWQSEANRRKFMEEMAIELGIKEPQEWGKVTFQQISKLGGTGLLKYFDFSLLKALQKIFPGNNLSFLELSSRNFLEP